MMHETKKIRDIKLARVVLYVGFCSFVIACSSKDKPGLSAISQDPTMDARPRTYFPDKDGFKVNDLGGKSVVEKSDQQRRGKPENRGKFPEPTVNVTEPE